MKAKIILSSFFVAGTLFAGTLVSSSELPNVASEFISTHFKDAQIVAVEKDFDSYEVKLSNGAEIEFTINGDLKEIDGKYVAIPDSILPDVLAEARKSQNGAKLMEIEKKLNGYELKFNNNMEVYINNEGKIIRQKLD